MATLYDAVETADIESSSDAYARRFSGAVGAWFLQVQEEATLHMLAPYPGATVLDVGGGHGQLTAPLLCNGYQVTVLGSAEVCKARVAHLVDERRCYFRAGNLLNLPYPDQSFDVVLSYRLLPHLREWRRFLSELTRVAREAVIVDYPSIRSLNYFAPHLFSLKKQLEGNTRPFVSFDGTQMVEAFQALHFHCVEAYPQFFLPMVLHRTLKTPRLSSSIETFCRRAGLTGRFGSPVILKSIRKGR